MFKTILFIQACLPLIDDLSNPAMRTRHWKKLVQVTKGGINIDSDSLKRMTLGELLGLGLQSKSSCPCSVLYLVLYVCILTVTYQNKFSIYNYCKP